MSDWGGDKHWLLFISVGVMLPIHRCRQYSHSEVQYHYPPPSTSAAPPKGFHAWAPSLADRPNSAPGTFWGRRAQAHTETPASHQFRRGGDFRARRRQRSHYLWPQSLQSSPCALQASVCQAFQVPLPPLFAARWWILYGGQLGHHPSPLMPLLFPPLSTSFVVSPFS